MDFEVRKQKALAIMVRHNMFKCNYAPPLIRFLWWLGVKFPAAVCFVLAGFRVDGRQFLRNVRAVDVSYGLASTGDESSVRLCGQSYHERVIWLDDGFLPVATKSA